MVYSIDNRYMCSSSTFIAQIDLSSISLRHPTADAAHAGLDCLLCVSREGAGGTHDLHLVGDDAVAVAALDGATGDHTRLQRILLQNIVIHRTEHNCADSKLLTMFLDTMVCRAVTTAAASTMASTVP